MIGVNISGGEYKESGLAYGRDYIFPSNAEIDYYAGKGMDVIRVPFQWERMQKVENGALNGEEVARLKAVVAYANTKGLTVILDAHDYGTRTIGGTSYKLGVDDKAPASLLADFWGRMASEFKGSGVFYGIMNEPHYQTAAQWAPVANAAIQAIRDAGASEKILVPGTNWTGAHNWVSGQNDTEIGAKVVDPLHNFAFEVHQYLDSDSSGTHASVVSETIGVERLSAITAWAKATGNQLFLGEFGVAQDATSLKAMDNMLKYMDDHADTWLGGTYWAGGAWWGNYMYSIEPTDLKTKGVNATDKAQMDILEKYDIDITTMPGPQPEPGVTINGSGKAEVLTGTTGNDVINGLGGSDTLDGKGGADRMTGGTGNDTYIVDHAGDVVVETPGDKADTILASVSYTMSASIERMTLTGTAALNGTGNTLANTITGNAGANKIDGASGNDILSGGLGLDLLSGGSGKDAFVFDTRPSSANIDTILDFSVADDTIRVDNVVFTALTKTGTLATGGFYKGLKAHDADDRILYDSASGALSYDADGTGGIAAVKFAEIAKNLKVTAADFLVI
jgi:endoglucanase